MQNLGDFFSDALKEQLADDNFKIGAVLKYPVSFTNPPKSKRLIIIGFDRHKVVMAVVLVNSEINPQVFPTPQLKNLHLELDTNNRHFLEHTSYVDCSKIWTQDALTIKNLIATDPSIHIGELSNADLVDVLDKIRNAPNITPKEKKRFGFI
jgi:hypothetical protein